MLLPICDFYTNAVFCMIYCTFAESFQRMRFVLSLMIIAILIAGSSWGFFMHRTIQQLAIYQLPGKMEPFFYRHMDTLVKHSIRPDERRNKDKAEAPKHFIDLEAFGDSAAYNMPLDWNDAVRKYSLDTLKEYGFVPYWILHVKEQLTNAFKKEDADSILYYAADLGHYIADAHVPLHTTLNYDGQLTNQKGLHALWESVAPEILFEEFNLVGKSRASYLTNPERSIWQAIRHSHRLVPSVLDIETEVSQKFTTETKYRIEKRNNREYRYYTKEFAKAYGERLKHSINDQALRSANLTADFWYTAWVDGGKPDLRKLLPTKFKCRDKKDMKKENAAYRANQLLQNNLLLSGKNVVIDPSNK